MEEVKVEVVASGKEDVEVDCCVVSIIHRDGD